MRTASLVTSLVALLYTLPYWACKPNVQPTRNEQIQAELPFRIDEAAASHLAQALRNPPEGMAPTLSRGIGRTMRDNNGRLLSSYRGEHFFIGYNPESDMREWGFVELTILDVTTFIRPSSLERLRGKTLAYDAENRLYVARDD